MEKYRNVKIFRIFYNYINKYIIYEKKKIKNTNLSKYIVLNCLLFEEYMKYIKIRSKKFLINLLNL